MGDDKWSFGSDSSFGNSSSNSQSNSFGGGSSFGNSFGNSQSTSFDGSSSFGGFGSSGGDSFGGFGSASSNMGQQNNAFAENSPWGGDTKSVNIKQGGWCVSITLASLASAGLAFGLAYLCRDYQRNVPLFGLVFLAPALLLVLLVLLIEHVSSPMNPRYSRKAQGIIAIILAAAIFLLGCIGEFIHEYVAVPQAQYVIVQDKSGSMEYLDGSTINAVTNLLDTIPQGQRVGHVMFSHEVLGSIKMDTLDNNRSKIISAMKNQTCTGGTDFVIPLNNALSLIVDTNVNTRILLITDGVADLTLENTNQLLATCNAKNASISCVYIDVDQNQLLNRLVSQTGGKVAYVKDASTVLAGIQDTDFIRGKMDLYHTTPKAGRDKTITAFVLILLSIFIGIALTLMLSRRGQKRCQLFLSPLFGVIAFFVLNYIGVPSDTAWVLEGAAQSLPLLVFMRSNS